MHRSLLRLFVGLARNATPLALLGFFVVAAGVVAESIGVTVTGLAILAIGRLTQIVQIGRYEKRRHEAEVRTKYKALVAEHWKLTPPSTPEPVALPADAGQANARSKPQSEA